MAGFEEHLDGRRIGNRPPAGLETSPDFPEVPARLRAASRWSLKLARRWKLPEGIVHLEGRATIKAVERVAGFRVGRDGRALLLGDNMAVVLAFARARARTTSC